MKKALVAFGAAFVGLIVLFGGMFVAGYSFATSHDREGKIYVDTIVPLIVTGWNDAALMAEASPEMLQIASRDQVHALFRTLGERLGALKEYGGATRIAYFVNFTTGGRVLTLTHTAPAVFEGGPAMLRIRTIRRGGQWNVLEFYLDAEALLRDPGDSRGPKRMPTI